MDMNTAAAAVGNDDSSSGNFSKDAELNAAYSLMPHCTKEPNGIIVWSTNNNKSSNKIMKSAHKAAAHQQLNAAYGMSLENADGQNAVNAKNDSPSRDFDLNSPTRYFKSSFARSLSLSSSSYARSLDFEINPQLAVNKRNDVPAKDMHIMHLPESKPPPIPARRPLSALNGSICQKQMKLGQHKQANNTFGSADEMLQSNAYNNNSVTSQRFAQPQQRQLLNIGQHSSNNKHSGFNKFARKQQSDVTAAAVQFIKPSLAEHARDADGNGAEGRDGDGDGNGEKDSFDIHNTGIGINVEAVVLQNQVDTLQWQMKQMESSCDMYRAVLEEVARFFDRFQTLKEHSTSSQQHKHGEQITRSKSLYHVFDAVTQQDELLHDEQMTRTTNPYVRVRSSTNLIDLKALPKKANKPTANASAMDNSNGSGTSYEAFKDFTWRRSPRKKESKINIEDNLEEKLQQEAFRMSRTIHNVLNTQQADLRHHRSSRMGSGSAAVPQSNFTAAGNTHAPRSGKCAATAATAAVLANEPHFLRTQQMRDSRLSLRSSTDSSAHSTISSAASSSSKIETDEEPSNFCSNALSNQKMFPQSAKQAHLICSTEDESGFSSISSYQEVGLPMNSTLISNGGVSSNPADISLPSSMEQFYSLDADISHSRNSTLKPSTSISTSLRPNSMIGVPVRAASLSMQQPAWDIAHPKTSFRNASQHKRFSTLSNEDSATVLWV